MESDLTAARKELESTKNALKVQTVRCRHLVSAFTKKLAQKDAEIKATRDIREKQLSSLLRALLILEARLKREQKSIREMLAEKDNIINEQKLEIEKLKAEIVHNKSKEVEISEETKIKEEDDLPVENREVFAKPDLISSLGIRDAKEASDSSDTASTKSCMGDESDYTVLCSPRVLNVHDRSAFSPIRSRADVKPEPREDYQDNPVLQCVNQILLKDQEDFLEEQRQRVKEDQWDEEDSAVDEEENSAKSEEPNPEDPRLNPPLPPKPKKSSGKRVEFADIKPQFHNPPPALPPPQSIESQLPLPLSILDHVEQSHDNELYVISNSALDDEIVKQLRGRTLNVSGFQLKQRNDLRKHSNVPMGLLHPNHNTTPIKDDMQTVVFNHHYPQPKQILKVSIQESPKRSSFGVSPPKVGMPDTIKVASPVATLLTSENQKDSPSVSQMVRRFEDLGTKKPGEEGKKEDNDSSVSYDNFLEATGLSQKSIMTPSRMMTNHRSVMKPKDVKLRSKVKAAGVIERCIPPQVVGPTVKYWTEPFL